MHIGRCLKVAMLSAGALLATTTALAPRQALAYNGGTHHSIVSAGWEVMRATSDLSFGTHIAWTGAAPLPLQSLGPCTFCGPGATTAAWNTFIARIPAAMLRLNGLDIDAANIPCSGTISTDNTLKNMLIGMGQDPPLQHPVAPCTGLATDAQGGAVTSWHPGGIFDTTAPNPTLDGTGFQGLLLGWESKTGDDHLDDATLESIWLIAGKTTLIIVGVALGIVLAPFLFAGILVLATTLGLLFCIIGIFDGTGCEDSVVAGFSKIIEAAATPTTILNNTVPELSGILPRGGDVQDPGYTGLWHFIHSQPRAGSNTYDDREGLDYDEAGLFHPGAFDIVIQAGADLADFHLGYDKSRGPHNYEIVGANDGHADSRRRSFAQWQGPTVGHLQFSPLDNFAFHGWRNFLSTPNAHWLSWPLHALGDATVPMHVVGSTGWGHRSYEDAVDWGEQWSAMRYMDCVPERGNCNATCMIGRAHPPAKTCPVSDKSDGVVGDGHKQFEQARTILEHAFRWTQFIDAWRTRTGRSTDVPVRDMITALALETVGLLSDDPNKWPWCDDCSMDWQFSKSHNRGMDFYETNDSIVRERDQIERSIGATIAFLVAAADRLPLPIACSTTTCGSSAACCNGMSCTAGQCCRAAGGACEHDSDCCGTTASPFVCRNAVCVANVAPPCQQAGQSCETTAACCADGQNSQQCGKSVNGVNVCCNSDGAACTNPWDCCNGSCLITSTGAGVCKRPLGSACTAQSQCEGGTQCESAGAPVSGGNAGTCCHEAAPGNEDCNADSDCCTGKCVQVGSDEFACRCSGAGVACARDNDCCAGNTCVNGVCGGGCKSLGADCQSNGDCCGAVCCPALGLICTTDCPICGSAGSTCLDDGDCCSNTCAGHTCLCRGTNQVCSSNAQCCSRNCVGGTCSASVR